LELYFEKNKGKGRERRRHRRIRRIMVTKKKAVPRRLDWTRKRKAGQVDSGICDLSNFFEYVLEWTSE